MKLILILAVISYSNAAKIDRNYLPPSYAQTSGGTGNLLQTPFSSPTKEYQRNFAQNTNRPTGHSFSQTANYAENGNNYAQNGNDYTRGGNQFAHNVNNYAQGGNTGNYNNFGNFDGRPERAQAALERNAAILRQSNQNDGETYAYAYETENGIVAEENGVATNGVEAQGGFSYTGDDGQVYTIRYTADQNGFVAQGDHLPTPPPIPEEILRALEQNAQDEANGIFDDGSYNDAKYTNEGDSGRYNTNNNYNSYNDGNNYNTGNNYKDDEDSVVTNNALFRSTENQPGIRNQAGTRNFNTPAYDNQVSNARRQNFGNQARNYGVKDAYLPPFAQGNLDAYEGQNQGPIRNGGPTNQGSYRNPINRVNKDYLPPFSDQRRNGFGRRTSFNARNGYQY